MTKFCSMLLKSLSHCTMKYSKQTSILNVKKTLKALENASHRKFFSGLSQNVIDNR